MRCPQCGERDTRVVDSRDLDDSATIRRRRECNACATRFTTYERIEAARLVIVKRDGTRQEFDRDKLAAGLMKGRSALGNDSPFAAVYPSTDTSIPQRKQDIAQAKQLMEAAGVAQGFKVTLTTERYLEIPEYAQLIQNWVKEIGVELELNILDQGGFPVAGGRLSTSDTTETREEMT